jgi:hypothetical protein
MQQYSLLSPILQIDPMQQNPRVHVPPPVQAR